MARIEQDREDILREATALTERVQITLRDYPEPIVAGFRRDGSVSFYFGADPVLQFNARRELRRGFDRGQPLKAAGGQLVRLQRERKQSEVILHSAPLHANELVDYLQRMRTLLDKLRVALQSGTARFDGQVPADRDVGQRVRHWLESLDAELIIADRPNAK